MFEAVMADDLPRPPVKWILNDGSPEMGALCRILPSGETAIFLKTLDLADSPRLEERLLMNVRRLLGNRRLGEISASAGLAEGSPIVWALLWVPESSTVDPDDAVLDVKAGNQQLWPKVLLSLPIAQAPGTRPRTENHTPSDSTTIGLQEAHTQSKSASSLFDETSEIFTAMAMVETEGHLKFNVDMSGGLAGLQDTKQPITAQHEDTGISSLDRQDWQGDTGGTDEEEEDDLFASSPSPGLVEVPPRDNDFSVDNPAAIDSVDRVSSAIFSPTLQPSTNLEATKYDISPRDQENPVNGFEAMITDDDFDFFDVDGQGPASRNLQHVPHEEYGDLSSVDFGINMNQVPEYLPQDTKLGKTALDMKAGDFDMDGETLEAPWPSVNVASGFKVDPKADDRKSSEVAASLDTPRESIRSDDDLWNDDPLPDQIEEANGQADIDMDHSGFEPIDTRLTDIGDGSRSEPHKSPHTIAPITALPSTPKSTPQDAVNVIQSVNLEDNFRQSMIWTLSSSAERLVPVDFEEILFDSTFFAKTIKTKQNESFDDSNIGKSMADLYGDGKVKTRTRLVALLEAGELVRRKAGSSLLPFHQESAADEIDICSPRSMNSQDTDGSDGSVGGASEITSDEHALDERERESILKVGHYPFTDYSVSLKRTSGNLEEQDCCLLQESITEHRSDADAVSFSAPFEAYTAEYVYRKLVPSPLTASKTSAIASWLSPLDSSNAVDYHGKAEVMCSRDKQLTADF